MNFFDAQDRAKRATRWLVIVYIIATIVIVMGISAVVTGALYASGNSPGVLQPNVAIATAVIATLFIIGATLFKTSRLSSGGGARVALDMGGTPVAPDVQDPLRRRLRNVVEEMAIASGIPVPQIYVMEAENGINAFAAGFTPADAAIAVTRGCLELLDRDELQGVIAHEFSHILNGDMRLNIRMMGVLFGIMVLGIIGRFILRSSFYGGGLSHRRSKNVPVVMIIGLGLAILGWVGVFFARLIKAAVSRQREFLADASAVQFTRQTDGLADALKKIGGYSDKSYIKAVDPEEVSHMLFAGGGARLTSLFATHPPLIERITALDPNFTEKDYPVVELLKRQPVTAAENTAGFSDHAGVAFSAHANARSCDRIAATVGQPEPKHLLFARQLRGSIPSPLYAAAHAPDEALLLAIALSLSSNEAHAQRQFHVIREQIGQQRAASIKRFYELILEAGAAYRLPLLEIAFPSIKNRPAPQLEFLLDLVRKLIDLDGTIDLGEYCYYRILGSQLLQAEKPAARRSGNRVGKRAAQRAAVNLIRVVADQGNLDPEAKNAAFEAGVALFGRWADDYKDSPGTGDTVETLDNALDILRSMNSAGRQSLLHAVCKTMMHDNKLTVTEAEMLRAICATFNCPLPPISESTLNSSN